jgi:hypothetical protein
VTPLILIPARQFSEGRPGKNREAWPALMTCLTALPRAWPVVVVTDDPLLRTKTGPIDHEWFWHWRHMGPTHTVAEVARVTLEIWPLVDLVIILQPSSPTRHRADYVRSAVDHLETYQADSSVVSIVPWIGEPPSKACTLAEDGTLQIPRVSPEPRQLQPRHYRRDGTVYAVRAMYARAGDLYGPRPVPLLVAPGDSVTLD